MDRPFFVVFRQIETMKTLYVVFATFALVLFGCSPKVAEAVEVVETVEVNEVDTPPNQGKLQCVFLGEDEFGTPRNEVVLLNGDMREKVSECLACEDIPMEAFESYQIPKNALSACGGWWAGAGDYYYSIQGKGGSIEVYFGWQDEEQEDDGYHWELKHTQRK